MKYLVHLRPSNEFSGLVHEYRYEFAGCLTKVSKNVLHTTLMTVYLNPADEEKVIRILEGLTWEAFDAEAENLDMFDESSLAIRIKRTYDLMALHNQVIESLRKCINWAETPRFSADDNRKAIYERFGSPYYAEFYNPHLTIAQVNPAILSDSSFDPAYFRGKGWKVSEFYLSRREPDRWETIRKFAVRSVPK
jgi:2'-5' RNA ligase